MKTSMNLNLDQLTSIMALVEKGTVLEAAEELGISRVLVGQRVAAAERILGRKLFMVLWGRSYPTSTAIKILEARKHVKALQNLVDAVGEGEWQQQVYIHKSLLKHNTKALVKILGRYGFTVHPVGMDVLPTMIDDGKIWLLETPLEQKIKHLHLGNRRYLHMTRPDAVDPSNPYVTTPALSKNGAWLVREPYTAYDKKRNFIFPKDQLELYLGKRTKYSKVRYVETETMFTNVELANLEISGLSEQVKVGLIGDLMDLYYEG